MDAATLLRELLDIIEQEKSQRLQQWWIDITNSPLEVVARFGELLSGTATLTQHDN